MPEKIPPYQLIAEFDGDRQEQLKSHETSLEGREVKDGDWLYMQIKASDGTTLDTKWFWIKGTEQIDLSSVNPTIDFYDLLVDKCNLQSGQYLIEYCIKRKPVWPNEFVRVAEISKNKMEIRVDAPTDEDALINIRGPLIRSEYYAPIDIYTGNHKNVTEKAEFIKAVSWAYDEHYKDETLILKLSDKIPRTIKVGDTIELWDEIVSKNQIEINLRIELPKNLETYTELRGPIVTLDVNKETAAPTQFEAWEEILSGTRRTNLDVVNNSLSQSTGARLNIDYSKFENFVHFSSAKERITNFQYKMALIEYYTSQSSYHSGDAMVGAESSSVSGSELYVSLSADFTDKTDTIVGGFDDYEKYLYFNSSSRETENDFVYSTTWPKSTVIKPHTNLSITSSEAQTWLTQSLFSASLYDESNMSYLRKTVPSNIENDSNNSGFLLFIDMIAQHFDICYNYIDQLQSQRGRDESLDSGISRDLIFETIKSFGWKPQAGLDLSSIWNYWLGTNESGSYQQTSSAEYPSGGLPQPTLKFVVSESKAYKDLELEPISRLINNLPYILKTKGTNRGLKALLNCYGVPSSFFKIQEFGGAEPSRNVSSSHLREVDIQNHSMQFQGGPYGSHSQFSFISGGWDNTCNTVEVRFKVADTNPADVSMSIFSTSAPTGFANPMQNAWIERSGSTDYGWIRYSFASTNNSTYHSGSTSKLPLFDNDWWNLSLRMSDTVTNRSVLVDCQKSPDYADGVVTHRSQTEVVVPATVQFGWKQQIVNEMSLGKAWSNVQWSGSSINIESFSGSMQEFRKWDSILEDWVLDTHTVAPTSIMGNSYSSSFENLLVRLPLGTDNVITATESLALYSAHPNNEGTGLQGGGAVARLAIYNLSGSFEYNEEDEVYHTATPNSFGLRPLSNKVRIEDNSVDGTLDPFKKLEASSADTNPIDLPDLYVSISPQDDLDLDIGLQFGALKIDNYIGDPRDKYLTGYPQLKKLRSDYFKKYTAPQNLQAFIRTIKFINRGLFKQIEQMLPARGANVVGLMIKPHLLERPKVATEPSFSMQRLNYSMISQDQDNLEHYTQSIQLYPDRVLDESDDYDAMYYRFEDGSGAAQWFSTLTDTIKAEAGNEPNRYCVNIATIQNGVGRDTDFDGNQLTWCQDGILTQAFDQPTSKKYYKTRYKYNSELSASLDKWISSSFHPTQVIQQDEFLGFSNSFFKGCKMTSPDFNIPSNDTIDGGPVVEFIEGNPNILISKDPGFDGELDVR